MRFYSDGPDIPRALVEAQEKGKTIFVCGAGVSRTVGVPLFKGLVESVYDQLGEDWTRHPAEHEGMKDNGSLKGQYDRVLRCLERRLVSSNASRNHGMRERIRSAVRNALAPPENADLSNHMALINLSRGEDGASRLLTTNFDTLFERAWFEKHGIAIDSHAGIAMPQPKSARCVGILHLHGRLGDSKVELNLSESDLVLTSAEFGDAYLRSGWASRYIYDLVRAYTVVLVGYQADDPPMRYLLEALESDRERFPDLQMVYAFAPYENGENELECALWKAKAVEPIPYLIEKQSHCRLYDTLREWQLYADNPTSWRRSSLREKLSSDPASLSEKDVSQCAELLSHGDSGQLLSELSPEAGWLQILLEKGAFDNGMPGKWISSRIDDPDMIRACAGLPSFDEQTKWYITNALEIKRPSLTQVRSKAWRLILSSKRLRRDYEEGWHSALARIRTGAVGYDECRLVSRLLRPGLKVEKPFEWPDYRRDAEENEELFHLLSLDLKPYSERDADEILEVWPESLETEIRLLRKLNRDLIEALEEADDLGLLQGWDRASDDVPSVAKHQQNAHKSGFYPITRVIAGLWERVAARDAVFARAMATDWAVSQFLLPRRLFLYSLANSIYTDQEAICALLGLDDTYFWDSDCQVEIMRLLVGRWDRFQPAERERVERRIRQGVPRNYYRDDAFDDNDRWESVRDSSVYRRLKRIETANGVLSEGSQKALSAIEAKHPKWRPGEGDRDDFSSWHESSYGARETPNLLSDVADNQVVKEAMRLQREDRYESGDIWHVFCSADPDRALRGLRHNADEGQWDVSAWKSLLWVAAEKSNPALQREIGQALQMMPVEQLKQLLRPASDWLHRQRETLSGSEQGNEALFLHLWDLLANHVFAVTELEIARSALGNEILTESLNSSAGVLARALVDAQHAHSPNRAEGFSQDLIGRFSKMASATGRSGLLARVYLARDVGYLEAIDPAWTRQHFINRFSWNHLEAPALWHSIAHGRIVSAQLFNALKPSLLAAFEQRRVTGNDIENLTSWLLSVTIWHRLGTAGEYQLTPAEVRRALAVGLPSTRNNTAWNLWRLMSGDNDLVADKTVRWRDVVGPIFNDIWPLDANLRSETASEHLVRMAMECEQAFSEAVNAIADFLVPYQLYSISLFLKLDGKHEQLIRDHPAAVVRLLDRLVDPNVHPIPQDLGSVLEDIAGAYPGAASDPAYIRLKGLARLRGA